MRDLVASSARPMASRAAVFRALIVAALVVFGAVLTAVAAVAQAAPPAAGERGPLVALGDPAAVTYAAGPTVSPHPDGGYRFTLSLSQPVEISVFTLSSPERVVVDFPEISWGFVSGEPRFGASGAAAGVRSVRVGVFRPGQSRLVLDLDGPVRVLSHEVVSSPRGGPAVLSVVFAPAPSERTPPPPPPTVRILTQPLVATPPPAVLPPRSGSQTVAPPRPAPAPSPETSTQAIETATVRVAAAPPPRRRPRRLTIMIDPGHGGRDPGAPLGGVLEKNITLDVGRRLARILRRQGRFDVLMTRDEDVFVELEERVRMSEAAGAALFISIHVNSLPSDRSVSGMTVFTLSETASSDLARELAERENAAGGRGAAQPERAEVSRVMFDFVRRRVAASSRRFAEQVIGSFRSGGLPVFRRGPHQQAGFLVLKSFSAASALVELGFITNRRDRQLMTTPRWREQAAEALAAAALAWAREGDAEPVGPLRRVASAR